MNKSKDIIYINTYSNDNLITYSGISLHDFISSYLYPLRNILLLKSDNSDHKFHLQTKFEYISNESIKDFAQTDTPITGDLCWIDFKDIDMLDKIEPEVIAELLYFMHMGKSLKSPFLEKLQNRIAYWSHDDNWYTKLHLWDIIDFTNTLKTVLIKRLGGIESHGKHMVMSDDIVMNLLKMTNDGLLIDFHNLVLKSIVEVPIYIIGKVTDMDILYNNLLQYKANATKKLLLILNKESHNIALQTMK